MKSLATLTLCLLAVITVSAQSLPTGGSHVVLPSPNSWSAANETKADVDLYTGRLNYTIPLHVLKSRDLEMPITLQYSSDGIKVNDLGSDVGLGWQLNAGGVIARVMRGLPDEFDGPYDVTYSCPTSLTGCHNTIPGKGFLDANVGDYADAAYFASASRSEEERKQVIENANRTGQYVGSGQQAWDTEPDEFYFNFDRYSGKFVFDKNGEIQIIPRQNLFITKTISNNLYSYAEAGSAMITSFQVTDDRGIKYTFGNLSPASAANMTAIEVTKYSLASASFQLGYLFDGAASYGQPVNLFARIPVLLTKSTYPDYRYDETPNKQTFTSSWYLTKVESPTGDNIILDYVSEEIRYITGRTHDVSQLNLDSYVSTDYLYFGTDKLNDVEPSESDGLYYHGQQFTISTSKSTIKNRKLNSITAASGERITITSTIQRPDLVGAKRIDYLNIMNQSNQWVKGYQFKYDLMTSPFEEYLYEFKVASTGGFLYPHEFMSINQLSNFIFSPVPMNQADWAAMTQANHFRLLLSSVAEIFPGTNAEDLVSFEYHTDFTLPIRFSAQQDEYGYYNSNPAGHTLRNITYNDTYNVPVQVPVVFASLYRDAIGNLYMRPTSVDLREVELKARTGSLKNIIHKNGSKTTINYSRFQGLRVSSLSTYPDKNGPDVETTLFNYYYPQSASIPAIYLAEYPLKTIPNFGLRTNITLSNEPVNQAWYKTHGGFIGYGAVHKIRTGNGREEFEFRNPLSDPDTYYTRYLANSSPGGGATSLTTGNYFPYALRNQVDYQRGQLRKRTVRNQADQVLQIDTYVYRVNPPGYVPQLVFGLKPGKYTVDDVDWYAASFYRYQTDWVYLDYMDSKVYDQSEPGVESKSAITTTRYFYNRPGESTPAPDMLARKISTILPNGDAISNETKYPLDFATSATPTDIPAKGIHLLKSTKMESFPIEGISYLERTEAGTTSKFLLSGSLVKFKEFQTGKAYPWESYKLKAGKGIPFSTYSWSTITNNVFTWSNSSNFKLSGNIDAYDAFGKPLSQTGEEGISNTMTWGYGNSLLTSIVQNAGAYQHQISYTHTPLVGVTQVTDPNSRSKKYTYDKYNRLKLESDHDNQIVARYRYHYQNQTEGFLNTVITRNGCTMAGESLTFSSAENIEHGQTTYQWNFGNGNSQSTTSTSIAYVYPSPGTFTVGLTKDNPEYAAQNLQNNVTIYKPIGSVNSSVTGPITYDVCTLIPPTQPTTLMTSFRMSGKLPGDAFNVVWEYQFNQGAWTQLKYEAGPVSSSSSSPPPGFGDSTMTGTWNIRCRGENACGVPFTATFTLTNYASNPLCSRY